MKGSTEGVRERRERREGEEGEEGEEGGRGSGRRRGRGSKWLEKGGEKRKGGR